jgi:triphosphoribosyl-dephospho-CoA synthetase
MRVAQLVDSSIYRLLTDMARIAQDSAENHHTKRLYNAINQMAQRIYGRKRKKERKSRRSAP